MPSSMAACMILMASFWSLTEPICQPPRHRMETLTLVRPRGRVGSPAFWAASSWVPSDRAAAPTAAVCRNSRRLALASTVRPPSGKNRVSGTVVTRTCFLELCPEAGDFLFGGVSRLILLFQAALRFLQAALRFLQAALRLLQAALRLLQAAFRLAQALAGLVQVTLQVRRQRQELPFEPETHPAVKDGHFHVQLFDCQAAAFAGLDGRVSSALEMIKR